MATASDPFVRRCSRRFQVRRPRELARGQAETPRWIYANLNQRLEQLEGVATSSAASHWQ